MRRLGDEVVSSGASQSFSETFFARRAWIIMSSIIKLLGSNLKHTTCIKKERKRRKEGGGEEESGGS